MMFTSLRSSQWIRHALISVTTLLFKEITREHGGRIGVRSTIGQATTLEVILPLPSRPLAVKFTAKANLTG